MGRDKVRAFIRSRRRIPLQRLSNLPLLGVALASILLFLSPTLLSKTSHIDPQVEEKSKKLLINIYEEVLELGSPYEECLKREFWIDLDKNPENKEEHVVILKHQLSGKERLLVQVTYYEPNRKNSPIKLAKDTKEILLSLQEGKMRIEECDYFEAEIHPLLLNILQGIKNKKKWLELIRDKKKAGKEDRWRKP